MSYHVIVWLDHHVAQIYNITRDGIEEAASVHASPAGHGHVHHRAGTPGAGHEPVSPSYLREVAHLLMDAQRILIVGPGETKHALKKFIAAEKPVLASRIAGVEPLGRADHGELCDFAQLFFRQDDRMAGGPPGH